MSDQHPPMPLPRDHDEASFSELVPFRSKKIKLHKSPILYFVAATAVFNVLLFSLRTAIIGGDTVDAQVAAYDLMVQVTLFYMLSLAVLGMHVYAKTDKSILYYIFPSVFVYLFMHSPLWELIYQPFNMLGLGDLMETADEWPPRLWSAFAGPGLREELVKAFPALIGAAITLSPGKFGRLPPRLRELLRVRGPLDGVLMGFAAGAAFLFSETGGQYVHGALIRSLKQSHGNLPGAFGDGLLLLVPRVMNGWVGHMAWSAILGYAVGLAVVRRRKAWTILLGGWFVAALLHGLWDSHPPGGLFALCIIGAVGGLLAISCLVKARQLETSLFGRRQESFGSIVVGAPAAEVAMPPRPASAMAAATPARPPPPPRLSLSFGSTTVPLTTGRRFNLADQPALAGQGAGVVAEVMQHPTKADVVGLRNVGTGTWYATLRDGTVQPIASDRNLRLASGVSIDFGAGLVGRVVAG